MFLRKIKQLISETNPDIIICTHALPSYLIARLKERNIWTGTVINAYTDYFINQLWDKNEIDFHFVPSIHTKEELLIQGVKPKQLFVTEFLFIHYFEKKKRF